MVKLPLSLTACFSIVVLPAVAEAQVAFNDFSSGNGGYGYDNSTGGWSVEGSSVYSGGQNLGRAMQFTSLASGGLGNIDLALYCSTGPLNISLTTDSSNAPSTGPSLDSWTVTPSNGYSNSAFFPPTTLSGNGTLLTAGDKYWIDVAPANASVGAGWYFNNAGAKGVSDYSLNGAWQGSSSGSTMATFDVNVTPEPITVGLGLAGVVVAFLRRRTG
ncbi:MAG: hypothetical protein ACYC96_10225 [Fimbriimonadaceae bacterium]